MVVDRCGENYHLENRYLSMFVFSQKTYRPIGMKKLLPIPLILPSIATIAQSNYALTFKIKQYNQHRLYLSKNR